MACLRSGNIYADEALFQSGIRPARSANRLTLLETEKLHAAIIDVLLRGIKNRGTTLRDYRGADGEKGSNQELLQVYGRGGLACSQCGRVLKKQTLAQRTTVYCTQCQK